MPTIDEIFETMEGDVTSTEYLYIDEVTREIYVPSSVVIAGVESDEDVQRLYFDAPAYADGNDLSTFDIYINYLDAEKGGNKYEVKDVQKDGDRMTFSWLLSRSVVAYKGEIQFAVCMKKHDGDIVTNQWNSIIAKLTVLEGLETDARIIEAYPDIFQQWKNEYLELLKKEVSSLTTEEIESILI